MWVFCYMKVNSLYFDMAFSPVKIHLVGLINQPENVGGTIPIPVYSF